MKSTTIPPYASYAFPANSSRRAESAAYPVSNINQADQFNRESVRPFLKATPTGPLYTTPASVYASNRPIVNPESSPDWGSHVNCYRL